MARCVLTHREQFELTAPWRVAMPSLYRGLDQEFDPNHESRENAGYSHWTDNPDLAKQYGDHVYQYDLPDEAMGQSYINDDGERPLYYDNEGKAGLNGVSGSEHLIYHHHDDYDPSKIKPFTSGRADDLTDYRTERHRQETELEKATGGYGADKADYFARGGQPLITYKDWMKGRKGWGGEAQPVDSDFHYTAPEGSDYEPSW